MKIRALGIIRQRGQVGVDLAGAALDGVPVDEASVARIVDDGARALVGINSKSTLGGTSCKLSLPQFFSSLSFLA